MINREIKEYLYHELTKDIVFIDDSQDIYNCNHTFVYTKMAFKRRGYTEKAVSSFISEILSMGRDVYRITSITRK